MTKQEIEDARWLRAMRFTFAQIGGFVGVSANTVRAKLDKRIKRKVRAKRAQQYGATELAARRTPEFRFKRKCWHAGVSPAA